MRLQHVRALDGVRGLAIVIVVVHHIAVRAVDPSFSGWSGVDVFFALSGFLITQSVLTSTDRLGEFYRRRFWRLAPALAVLLVVAAVLWPVGANGRWLIAAATQWLNLQQGFGSPPFSPHLAHLWSISAEAQFYAVWALGLVLLVRWKAPRWAIVALLVGLFVASQVERTVLVGDGDFLWNRPYFSPDTRSAALVTGCLAGLAFAWGWLDGAAARSAIAVLTVPAAVALWWATTVHHLDAQLYTTALPLVAVAAAVLVVAAATSAPSPIRWALALQPMPFLGRISYSLYLWHLPIFEEVGEWRGDGDLLGLSLVGLPLALTAALASYHLVERPLMRGVRRTRVPIAA